MEQNFAESQTKLFKKAVNWWKMHKPVKFTFEQHLENPGINIPDQEGRILAKEIARIIKNELKEGK